MRDGASFGHDGLVQDNRIAGNLTIPGTSAMA
jgi:hypothetical protein